MMTSITAWRTAVIDPQLSPAASEGLLVGVMVEEHLQEPPRWKQAGVCREARLPRHEWGGRHREEGGKKKRFLGI